MNVLKPYMCKTCKFPLKENDFAPIIFNTRKEIVFILCNFCKNNYDKLKEGNLNLEEVSQETKKHWNEKMLELSKEMMEAKLQGKDIEVIKESKMIECCRLIEWFDWTSEANEISTIKFSDERKKITFITKTTIFFVILDTAERNKKLCADCLKLKQKTQGEFLKKVNNNE